MPGTTHLYLRHRFTGGLQGIFYLCSKALQYKVVQSCRFPGFWVLFVGKWQNCFIEGSTNLQASPYTGNTLKIKKIVYPYLKRDSEPYPTLSVCRFYTYLNHVVSVFGRAQRRAKYVLIKTGKYKPSNAKGWHYEIMAL